MITVTIQFFDLAGAVSGLSKLLDNANGVASYTVPAPAPQASGLTLVADRTAAALANEAPGKPEPTPAPAARRARSQPTAEAAQSPAEDAPAQATAKPAASPSTVQAAAANSADKPVEYKDLQQAVVKLHQRDPTAALPIAQSFGAATFKLLPMDKWGAALALVQAKLAELEG